MEVAVPGRCRGVRVLDDGGRREDGVDWADNRDAGRAAGRISWMHTKLLYVSMRRRSLCGRGDVDPAEGPNGEALPARDRPWLELGTRATDQQVHRRAVSVVRPHLWARLT